MNRFDAEAAVHSLSRAKQAQDLMAEGQHKAYFRALRDDAVRTALEAGLSPEQLADDLGVSIKELEQRREIAAKL
jgi:hypothetical protein